MLICFSSKWDDSYTPEKWTFTAYVSQPPPVKKPPVSKASLTHGSWWKLLVAYRLWRRCVLHSFLRMNLTFHFSAPKYTWAWAFSGMTGNHLTAGGFTTCRREASFRLHFMKLKPFKITDSKNDKGLCKTLIMISYLNASLDSTFVSSFFFFFHAFGINMWWLLPLITSISSLLRS